MDNIIGIDEVGRGALAGPVAVCACAISNEKEVKKLIFHKTIRDSKKLTKDKRISIFKSIKENSLLKKYIIYSVSYRSAQYIDKYGINHAIEACMYSCLRSLSKRGVNIFETSTELDGGLFLDKKFKKQKTYIKGDQKFTSIALASIIAKVLRDKKMESLSHSFPHYKWGTNAGYGTKEHREKIISLPLTIHHRKTFLTKILKKKD